MPRLLVGEAQLRAILDAIPSRVALYDRDRRHCYVNREYAAFVGRRPDEVVGLTLPEVMGRETYARLEPYYRQLRPHSAKALGGEPSRWEGWLPYSAHRASPASSSASTCPTGGRMAPWTATSSSPAT